MAKSFIRVPKSQESALAELFRLSEDAVVSLERALGQAVPTLSIRDLSANVARGAGIDEVRSYSLLRLLASLYNVRDRKAVDLREFVADVIRAAHETGKEGLRVDPADIPRVTSALIRLLSDTRVLGVTAKAGEVISEHDRLFCDARVVTDLRPVFSEDVRSAPAAFVVVHNLRVSNHKGDDYETIEIALDSADVERLRKVLDRATEKEATLKQVAEHSGFTVLSARSHEH